MANTRSGVTNRIALVGDRFTYNGISWPLRGAHATVSDKRCGLTRRKHMITMTVTSGDCPVMTWQAQRTGEAASGLYRPWSTFAANLNQAAEAGESAGRTETGPSAVSQDSPAVPETEMGAAA